MKHEKKIWTWVQIWIGWLASQSTFWTKSQKVSFVNSGLAKSEIWNLERPFFAKKGKQK
jgi:hypothetical protein